MINKKRRCLEIFQIEKEDEQAQEDESFNLSEEHPILSCSICDVEFPSSEELESHNRIHSVPNTSPFILNVEKEIFDEILTQETDTASGESVELSESLLHNYEDLLDNLISSVSPNELLQKISITNEIPEDFSVTNSELQFKTETTKSIARHSPPINGDQVTWELKKRKVIPVEEEERDTSQKLKKIKSDKDNHSVEDIEFENEVNKKIFKILSRDSQGFSKKHVKTGSLRFSLTTPWLPPSQIAPDQDLALMPKLISPKKSPAGLNRRFQAREKFLSRLTISTALDKSDYANFKRSKRGTLGYHIKMELDHDRVKVEEEGEVKDCRTPSPTEPSSQTSPSRSPTPVNENIESKTEETQPWTAKCPEVSPNMPVFVF